MTKIKVRPKEGIIIRMPERNYQKMPTEGLSIHLNEYYRNRIMEGDLVTIQENNFSLKRNLKTGVNRDNNI